jgi:hypothetical protein
MEGSNNYNSISRSKAPAYQSRRQTTTTAITTSSTTTTMHFFVALKQISKQFKEVNHKMKREKDK